VKLKTQLHAFERGHTKKDANWDLFVMDHTDFDHALGFMFIIVKQVLKFHL